MKQKQSNLLLYGILAGLLLGVLYGVFWIGHRIEEEKALMIAQSIDVAPLGGFEKALHARITEGHDFRIVKTLGELFINGLKMLVVPLVLLSMMTGIANLGDIRHVGRTGRITLLYFLATTGIAVGLGILLVNLIQPGAGSSIDQAGAAAFDPSTRKFSVYDILTGMISPNIFQSMANMEIMPVIVFGLVFGGILSTMGEKGRLVLNLAEACYEAVLKFVQMVVAFAPVGVFGLVGAKLGQEVIKGSLASEISRLAMYALTVEAGLLLHGFVILPLILWFYTRRNPVAFILASAQPLLTAFSTGSSSATLPVTLECMEAKAGVSSRYASFVCPLGATLNMNGTALYEAVAALFVAQALGADLTAYDQAVIFFTATLAAIGAPGIPEAGLVTMIVVFQSVGLDPVHIGTLISIDWFLDRCRTAINVFGDMTGAAIVQSIDEKGLQA